MSSILTNTAAMTALQTLKGINKNLHMIQEQVSTGKKINSAKDNAGIWAVSSVMDSDVRGFKAISDSLSLGQATVAVARNAAETVKDLLVEMKALIVTAQGENVDRAKLQNDIQTLRTNIEFFARSKNADKLREEYEGRIADAQKRIAHLQHQLDAYRG